VIGHCHYRCSFSFSCKRFTCIHARKRKMNRSERSVKPCASLFCPLKNFPQCRFDLASMHVTKRRTGKAKRQIPILIKGGKRS